MLLAKITLAIYLGFLMGYLQGRGDGRAWERKRLAQ